MSPRTTISELSGVSLRIARNLITTMDFKAQLH